MNSEMDENEHRVGCPMSNRAGKPEDNFVDRHVEGRRPRAQPPVASFQANDALVSRQHRLDFLEQHVVPHGLLKHPIGGAGLGEALGQTGTLVHGTAGQGDDADVRIGLLQFFENLKRRHPGHVDVRDDGVGVFLH